MSFPSQSWISPLREAIGAEWPLEGAVRMFSEKKKKGKQRREKKLIKTKGEKLQVGNYRE